MQDYKKLTIWVRAHQFVLDIYSTSRSFPEDERYGLTSQIRRASASIVANIVEGSVKGSKADFKRYLHISLGSAAETEYFLLLAKDLGILEAGKHHILAKEVDEIKKMLSGLIKSLAKE